jgi:hypothetical protein
MSESIVCTNCEAFYHGNFCPECGQKRFTRNQFDFKKAMRDLVAEVFDLESALGRTLKRLILSPGQLTTDFLAGKQKSYVGPVKLYLVIITINFLLYSYLENYSLVNIGFLKNIRDAIPFLRDMIQIDIAKDNVASSTYYHQINQRVNEILPVLLYFLIFLQALVLKLQFSPMKRYYMEHLVFSLHFMAFGFLRDVAILPIQLLSAEAGFVITIVTTIMYLHASLKRNYRLTVLQAVIHTAFHYVVFFFMFFMTILCSIVLALWSI